MDPITIGLLIGAAGGLLNSQAQQTTDDKNRQVQAKIAQYSPWTHMTPGPTTNANPVGNVMQGALAGGMFGAKNSAALSPTPGTTALTDTASAPVAAGTGGAPMSPASGYGGGQDFNSWLAMLNSQGQGS